MDSLSRKIQNLGIHDIRNAARFAQNMIVQYEPYQVDIRRATNTDSWGPTPKHLAKVLRNRYQVPLYLMTEYTLKRLVDHVATRPKNLYEKARKDYVNYGSEWRVVLKCLAVLEFLLLNVADGDELNQVRSCLVTHKHLLSREVMGYRVGVSSDGKMEVHERGIRKKCEQVLQLLEDSQYLKRERQRHARNNLKIRQQGESSLYNANPVDSSGSSPAAEALDDDEGADDELPETVPQQQRQRRRSHIEEQRRQRREILRERIKNTEIERKRQLEQAKARDEPDLLDLIDFDDLDGVDDDDFGDFQGGDASATSSNPTASDILDLLDWTAAPAAPAASTDAPAAEKNAPKKHDAFADLFSHSKSLI
ncbi:hypothetical protein HG536_0C01220 [Torulaspora globosa]|uniref:ENTH domain-containing protein n=1 Tax=Torulaspora globosa TaxID=48254 RepID=A0A7G3ZEL8_9SACH|nr:uncharacterized protein HG536_0C01220 [Torulaspora globosa]QLL31954.1 hypothetical protein HG536_0C01220 [Torulaspora globosa]